VELKQLVRPRGWPSAWCDEAIQYGFIVCVREGRAKGRGLNAINALYELGWDEGTDYIKDLITYALALVARILTPTFQRQIARLCVHLAADVPQLGTTWVVHFRQPHRSGGSKRTAIDATLQQFGRFLRGSGHLQGEPGKPFEYRGIIKRNVFYGTFRRKKSHILAGTGTFVLKISPDSRDMAGHCTWYDNVLDDVWASDYMWTRKG
jgi:hypothetical protein